MGIPSKRKNVSLQRLKEIQAQFALVEADRVEQKKSIQALRQERIRLEERIRNGTEKGERQEKDDRSITR